MSVIEKQGLIDENHDKLSVREQCKLLSLNRSTFYYEARPEGQYNLILMRLLDEEHMRYPFKGVLRLRVYLNELGYWVNVKRIRRLLREMGIEAIYPRRNLSKANLENKKYPYLLKNLVISHNNHVWSTDITYIRLKTGFMYLVAVMDWYGKPEIFNTDQGVQFTSEAFTGVLLKNKIQISMDSKGRALDNIFIERLWRSVKYEEVYLHEYLNAIEAKKRLGIYFNFYNTERHHQSLNYKKPADIYFRK